MTLLQALIFGIVQGLTEFIPVSSSGHLVLLHELFGTTGTSLSFDVALHGGTLLALLIFFHKDIWNLILAVVHRKPEQKLAWLLVLATIPAAVFGFLLESSAETTFRSARLVAMNLIIAALLMFLAEWLYKSQKSHASLKEISWKQALGIGFAQGLAIVPGVSRSGSTITAGIFFSLDRVAAMRFGFLLGIPIIGGAFLKILLGGELTFAGGEGSVLLVGMLSAFISGLFAIKFLLAYLSKHSLAVFAWYRIALGVAVLLFIA